MSSRPAASAPAPDHPTIVAIDGNASSSISTAPSLGGSCSRAGGADATWVVTAVVDGSVGTDGWPAVVGLLGADVGAATGSVEDAAGAGGGSGATSPSWLGAARGGSTSA